MISILLWLRTYIDKLFETIIWLGMNLIVHFFIFWVATFFFSAKERCSVMCLCYDHPDEGWGRKALVWCGFEDFWISVEEVKGELLIRILERGRGCSSWIRFGELSSFHLLDGVELCSQGDGGKPLSKGWLEGERVYRVECRCNDAGKFILCSMCSTEAKGFVLVFLEGKDCSGGWGIVARKLCNLGVTLGSQVSRGALLFAGQSKERNLTRVSFGVSFADKVKKGLEFLGKAVWFQMGEKEVCLRILWRIV